MAENGDPTDQDDSGEEPTRRVRRILKQQGERRRLAAGDEAQERLGEEFQDYLDSSPMPTPFPVGQPSFATGRECPRPTGFDPPELTKRARAAVVGESLFNVTEVVVGGAEADDVTVVSSQRVEFVVPDDADEDGKTFVRWEFGDPLAQPQVDLIPEPPGVSPPCDGGEYDYVEQSSSK